MIPFLHALPRSVYFLLLGMIMASGAPIGWWLCSSFIDSQNLTKAVYLYMLIGTTLTFGGFGFFMGHSQDLLYKLLEKDSLTVLLNQKAFFRHLEAYHQIGLRYNDRIGVIMMDIDHFKQVNDQHNHLVGSEVLKQLGQLLANMTRDSDIVARYGGDEFSIGIPRIEDPAAALALAERIRCKIAAEVFQCRGHSIRITVSMGLAVRFCDGTSSVDQLVQDADQMLYQAKHKGRNRVEALLQTEERGQSSAS